MKKFIAILAIALLCSSCATTYYTYYEVESPEMASIVSQVDATWQRSKKTPTRCVAVYPDSLGHNVYLMETKTKEK